MQKIPLSESNDNSNNADIVFVHVAKSGGTSVASAIIDALKPSKIATGFSLSTFGSFKDFDSVRELERNQIISSPDDLAPDAEFVSGHIDYKITKAAYPLHKFVLVVREARSRLISHWLFWRAQPEESLAGWGAWKDCVRTAREDLAKFLSYTGPCGQTDNMCARLLLNEHPHIPTNNFIDEINFEKIISDVDNVIETFNFLDYIENENLEHSFEKWLGMPFNLETLNVTTPPPSRWSVDINLSINSQSLELISKRTYIDDYIWRKIVEKKSKNVNAASLREDIYNRNIKHFKEMLS